MMKLFVLGIMVAGIFLMAGCRAEPVDPDRVVPPNGNMENTQEQTGRNNQGNTLIPMEGNNREPGGLLEEEGMTIQEVSYVGQIDNNSIETKVMNGREEEFLVLRLSEEVREKFEEEDMEEGDKIRVKYKYEDNQANVLYDFERRDESAR
jgi:hypothetical protein